LNQVKEVGMGQPSIGKPEIVDERFGIDNEGISLPFASGVAVVQRVVVIAPQLADLRPAICVNEMPDVIAATLHQKDASEALVLEKLHAVRLLELTDRTRRHAVLEHRVVLQLIALPL